MNMIHSSISGQSKEGRSNAAATMTAALLFGLVFPLKAATVTWDGGGADNNWSTGANWSGSPDNTSPANPSVPPVTDNTTPLAGVDVVSFAGTTRPTSNVDTAWYIDALRFESTATPFTLTGSTITFRPSNGADHDGRYFLLNASGKTQTIDNNLVILPALGTTSNGSGIYTGGAGSNLILNGTLSLNGTSGFRITNGVGGTVTFNGVISSTGGADFMAVNSGATAIFNALNTHTKGLTVWNGTAKAGVNSLNGQAGAFGNSSSAVGIGHGSSGGASILTTAAVEIGRDFAITRNTLNGGYIFGGESAHVSTYSGVIYNGNDSAAGTAVTLTAATGGRVNVNSVTRRGTATSGSLGEDSLTKTGAGIVALTGTSSYSGVTNVNAGTLLVNGTISASAATTPKNVIVSTTAALGGSGVINRDVVLNGAATLTPGNMNDAGQSLGGALTINGGLDLASTNVLNFGLGSGTSDSVIVNGNLTLAGTLNVADLGGFGVGNYLLFDYGDSNTLTYNPASLTINTTPNPGLSYAINTTSFGSAVYLVVTPEPGRAFLLFMGCAASLMTRRRRTVLKK